jgi:predicted amidohydrolase YtcJ
MFLVYGVMPPLDGLDRKRAYQLGEMEMLSYGLTTVIDAATFQADWEALEELYCEGRLRLRIRAFVPADPWPGHFLDSGPRSGLYGERLSLDGIKLFSDGSLGSRSAWLMEDYADQRGHRGDRVYADKDLLAIFQKASDLNLQVAIHVIGDGAVAQAVGLMEKVLGSARTSRHWRLEHFQVVDPKDLDKALAMGLVPSIQSVGLMTDLMMAEDRLGRARLKRAYAWRQILDKGGILINGSDMPVESPNPFHGIYAAVSRRDLKGRPPEGFMPQEALTRMEALKSYTVWPAQSASQGHNIGSLAVGKLADLAVLDRNPLKCPERELADIKVTLTAVDGQPLYTG